MFYSGSFVISNFKISIVFQSKISIVIYFELVVVYVAAYGSTLLIWHLVT